jgi:hypothetical protein
VAFVQEAADHTHPALLATFPSGAGEGERAPQDFFPGGLKGWPVAPCDFLYSETEVFGLSDFGFLASLLLLI